MSVIAVINRKGGSGKSTVATHIAARLAHDGDAVMLGDIDFQQSSRAWLRRRNKLDATRVPAIQGWTFDKTLIARPPSGVRHLVLDTPGGLTGFDLARLVMWCDVIVMPVCDSTFDRESAAKCHAELMALPRVAGGRCRLGAVGMRIDRRTRGHEALQAWAAKLGVDYLGSLRDAKLYVKCAERGLTLFDLPPQKAAADLEEWVPVQAWLQEAIAASTPDRPQASAPRPAKPRPDPALNSPSTPTQVAAAATDAAGETSNPRRRSTRFGMPRSLGDDLPRLTLAGVGKPGFWAFLRRLWRA